MSLTMLIRDDAFFSEDGDFAARPRCVEAIIAARASKQKRTPAHLIGELMGHYNSERGQTAVFSSRHITHRFLF